MGNLIVGWIQSTYSTCGLRSGPVLRRVSYYITLFLVGVPAGHSIRFGRHHPGACVHKPGCGNVTTGKEIAYSAARPCGQHACTRAHIHTRGTLVHIYQYATGPGQTRGAKRVHRDGVYLPHYAGVVHPVIKFNMHITPE